MHYHTFQVENKCNNCWVSDDRQFCYLLLLLSSQSREKHFWVSKKLIHLTKKKKKEARSQIPWELSSGRKISVKYIMTSLIEIRIGYVHACNWF